VLLTGAYAEPVRKPAAAPPPPKPARGRHRQTWLTLASVAFSLWAFFVVRELTRASGTNVVWWAGLPVLVAGPVAVAALVLSLRRPRKPVLVMINGALAAMQGFLWLTMLGGGCG
jgi:hypothetical protein